MTDLGDAVVLTFLVKDASGNLVDDATAAVTVTLPDGTTTATPAVVHASTGTYTASYTTTTAGRHTVRWTATTAGVAYTDVFNVAPSASTMIISLDEARDAVGLTSAQTARDEALRGYVLAATPVIEDLVGSITRRTITSEWHDGGARTVRLLCAPVLSITTVLESWGTYTRTLTNQALDGSSFDSYGYTVDLDDGILTRRVSGRPAEFAIGRRNISVTYVAGRTVVGENIIKATRRLVKHLWGQEQTPGRPDLGGADAVAMTTTPSGFAVPRAVVELCAGDLRTVGIA